MNPKTLAERDILRQIIDWLKVKRIFHWRANTGAVRGEHNGQSRFIRFGVRGVPDIICVIGGRFVGIEVKKSGQEQSPAQKQFQVELEHAGGKYVLAYSLEQAIHGVENDPSARCL